MAKRPGFGWISALRNPAIQDLHRTAAIQLSLFEQSDLAEITHPDFPGERLIVCKNPLLAAERARKRVELLAATQLALETVQAATTRAKRALVGKDKDEDPAEGTARRKSIVAPAQRSVGALKKIAAKQGSEGLPAQSLRTLLRDLATSRPRDLATSRPSPETESGPPVVDPKPT